MFNGQWYPLSNAQPMADVISSPVSYSASRQTALMRQKPQTGGPLYWQPDGTIKEEKPAIQLPPPVVNVSASGGQQQQQQSLFGDLPIVPILLAVGAFLLLKGK